MRLLVVRHNESVGNVAQVIDDNSNKKRDENGLSEKGKKQSEELAKKLKDYKINVVILSPLKRTLETVKPYLDKYPSMVITSSLTLERNAGVFVGQPKNAIKDYCLENNITDRVSFRHDGGESILDVYERAKKFVSYLKKNFKNETILICGHVNFLECLDIILNNLDISKFYEYKPLENGQLKEYSL